MDNYPAGICFSRPFLYFFPRALSENEVSFFSLEVENMDSFFVIKELEEWNLHAKRYI